MKYQNTKNYLALTKVLVIAFSMLFNATLVWCQDPHFSNFTHAPAMINPAGAGFFPGHYRWMGLFRSQWKAVPVNYHTLAGGFDIKIRPPFSEEDLMGAGIFLFKDEAGDASLSNTMVAIQGAYHKSLDDRLSISAGFHIALHQRKADPNAVTWESQFNGDQFDPGLNSGELFVSQNGSYFSAGAGVSVNFQSADSRSRYSLGMSAYHLNEPQFSFYDDTSVKLKQRYHLLIQATQQLQPSLDLHFNVLFSKQGPYREILTEGLARKHFLLSAGNSLQIFGGLGLRWQDAIYPKIGLRINNTEAGFSYDINFSEWKKATLRRGGPELFLHHILWKVEPPTEFKPCPIF